MIHQKALLGRFTKSPWRLTAVSIFTLSLFLILTSPAVVLAQEEDNEPPWYQNLTCNDAQQQYQGIEYCTGLDGRAHVLVIDLEDEAGARFEYVISTGIDRDGNSGECRDVNIPHWSNGPGCHEPANVSYYPVMSLSDAVDRYPLGTAVVNTDYGAGDHDEPDSREHGPEGLTIIRGNRIDGPTPHGPGDTDNNAVERPWLAISEGAPFQILFDQLDSDDGSKPAAWMHTAVGGAPWLIRNGQKETDQINNCTHAEPWSCQSTAAQTAVAISQDRRWLYLVVVVGVDPLPNSDDSGADIIADFMLETLEPWEAIKFDGGGSSQMWYGGLPDNQRVVAAGDGRLLSQYLAVIAPPGDGIDLASDSPLPPLPDLESWWQQTWAGIQVWWAETWPALEAQMTDWWERTRDDLQQRLSAWWDEQMAALAHWIETELVNALNQLCGTAVILPVGLTLILWRQSKQHRQKRELLSDKENTDE